MQEHRKAQVLNLFSIESPIKSLQTYLHTRRFLVAEEQIISVDKPGKGNMNVILRITTNARSFILKQSRPFVQKYPQVEAPLERISVERQFYTTVQSEAMAPYIPKILGYIQEDYVLLLEDLGACEDMTYMYHHRNWDNGHLTRLTSLLSLIHSKKEIVDYPENRVMRKLNHQHIFVLPFIKDNGFHLDAIQPGLHALSEVYKKDGALKEIISTIGRTYLEKGDTLLHGDYYPGSWMTKGDDLFVIDPEFSFLGFAEFDLGVMAAHLIMIRMDRSPLELIFKNYTSRVDKDLMERMAGIEIMRRLIGLAQLPLERTIKEKEVLLRLAYKLITG